MARPYSVDLRERVVRAVAAGGSAGEGRPIRGEHQLRDQADAALAEAGRAAARAVGGGKRPTLAAPAERVQALLAAAPDLTIAELQGRLAAAGITTSRSALGRFLLAAGLTQEKEPARRRAAPPGCRRRAPRLARAAGGHEPRALGA